LSPWDVAAGSLLVTEAGGLVGNFTGEPEFMEHKECLAGNPRIYGQLVPILHKYSKFAGAGDKAQARQNAEKLSLPGAANGETGDGRDQGNFE
ncbi:MAG: inositol monophosphatase family protein, partial [Curvibacter sp.]